MATYLPARLLTGVVSVGHQAAMLAAAAETANGDGLVKAAIITGIFTTIGALIGAGVILVRARNPDLSELLALHERVAVNETNIATIRDDLAEVKEMLSRRRAR